MEEICYLVANYNCSAYVAECLRSLARQTDDGWRCVICDDCSTDDSLSVIERTIAECGIAARVAVRRSPHNLGYIGTLKGLLTAAKTDIVAILDADDVLAPNATAVMLREYRGHAGAGFVYSRYRAIDAQGQVIAPASPLSTAVPAGRTALMFGFVSHLKTFRKSVYDRTEGLDESIRYAEDRDLVYKLEEVAEPRFVNEVLYDYRLVEGSQSRDEEKFRAGIRNHVLARRNAVRRRGISGVARAVHECVNQCLLARARPHSAANAVWASVASRALRGLRLATRLSHHGAGRAPSRMAESSPPPGTGAAQA